jgi:hypothetical protein
MSEQQTQEPRTTVSLSAVELEALIRRVVREELTRLLHTHQQSILDDWSHEGADALEGDAQLLREALVALEQVRAHPETRMSLDAFEQELQRAEAAGELSD